MKVIPAPGAIVRDPVTKRVLDDHGLVIDPDDPHWARLLKDKDVLPFARRKPAKPAPSPATEAPGAADTQEPTA